MSDVTGTFGTPRPGTRSRNVLNGVTYTSLHPQAHPRAEAEAQARLPTDPYVYPLYSAGSPLKPSSYEHGKEQLDIGEQKRVRVG